MVNGEPDGRSDVVGPLDAMTDVRAQQHVMARLKVPGVGFVLEAETRASPKHDDPLVGVLVQPLPGRCDVAGRDDALDAHAGGAEQDVDALGRQTGGEILEKVAQAVSIASGSCHEPVTSGSEKRGMSNGADLIHQMGEGDADAFARFYDRYAPLIYPLILRILPDPTDAAECLQDVFWESRQRARTYDAAQATPDAWLVTRARARAIERMRSARRRRESRPLAPLSAVPQPTERPAALDRSVLTRAFERLPDPQREALELAYYGGLTQTEITARLKQPLGTVKTRLRLALDRLREMVKPA
jgi:RNA polymerase sigma-70 factor (ECF subfamily)